MKWLKYILILIIPIIGYLTYLKYISNCVGCGGCEYEYFDGIVKTDTIGYNKQTDSIEFVILKCEVDTSYFTWYLHQYDVYGDSLAPSQEYRDTNSRFRLKGKYAISGTFVPYEIHELKLAPRK